MRVMVWHFRHRQAAAVGPATGCILAVCVAYDPRGALAIHPEVAEAPPLIGAVLEFGDPDTIGPDMPSFDPAAAADDDILRCAPGGKAARIFDFRDLLRENTGLQN